MKPRIAYPLFAGLVMVLLVHAGHAAQVADDGGIVVDYSDAGYSQSEGWKEVCTWELVGKSYTPVRQTEQAGAWAKWTAILPTAGKYRVYFWHVGCSDSAAAIEIEHEGHTDSMTRNVAYGHLGWTSLGDYDFAAGEKASVKFTRGTGRLIVDAIQFLPVAKIKPIPALPAYPKADGSLPHLDHSGNLILSGQPYQVIYQELHEETTAHPEEIATNLDETFDMARAQGVNTLGTMIYWKTFEKTPGDYDYTMLDALIEKARARNMHINLILFFAWRNLQSYYLPAYIFKDPGTYLFDHLADGTQDPHRKVSPFADATRARETQAIAALFGRVLQKDPDHQVVIMAQIENETPAPRDYSAPAMAAWKGQVPQALIDFLIANEGSISRTVWDAWDKHGRKTSGTWAEIFGEDGTGNRIFGAWCAGTYIQALGSDLKKVLDIPYYMNAWLGESPSTYTYMDVFHAAAPVIDAMGPDAYGSFSTWENAVGLSQRSWNPLVIPEQGHTAEALWRAVGNYNAVISGEWFAVEGFGWLDSRETYDLYDRMSPLIASKRGSGDMMGFFQSTHQAGESWSEYFQDLRLTYTATVRPHLLISKTKPKAPTTQEAFNNIHPGELDGCGLLVSLGKGEYVLTSTRMDISLSYINGGPIMAIDAQSGHFENGDWIAEGPAEVEQGKESVSFHFPRENRHYAQVRFKLVSQAQNPAWVFEAERGNLLKKAEPIYDGEASGAFCVGNISGLGAGVEISTNLDFAAQGMTIRYSSLRTAKARVLVNGKSAVDVEFPATAAVAHPGSAGSGAAWEEKSVAVRAPAGTTIDIEAGERIQGPNIDCIILSRDAVGDAAPGKMP
jgi:hypothetical protein